MVRHQVAPADDGALFNRSLRLPFRAVQPRAGQPGISVKEANPSTADVEKELRAQIELAKKMIPHLSYMSTHMTFRELSPEVAALVQRLSKEYGLAMAGPELGIQRFENPWEMTDKSDARVEKFAAKLASLGPGTWLMIQHCATDDPEVRAISANVVFHRSAVVATWTDPKVLEAVRKRGIKLTNYRELMAAKR